MVAKRKADGLADEVLALQVQLNISGQALRPVSANYISAGPHL